MRKGLFRKVICISLVFSLSGCGSDYVLNLYSKPPGAKVQIGSKITGRTPCKLEIPGKSDLIKHHHIDVTYTLEDGREVVKSYDLRKYKPPETLALVGGGIFAAPGALLLWLSLPDKTTNNEASFFDESDEYDDPYWPGIGVGLGLVAIGGLIFYALGGDSSAESEYNIHETFENIN